MGDLYNFFLHRLKDPGQERTEFRTRTATRTSSKTAARFSVGQHTRGNSSAHSRRMFILTFFVMFCICLLELEALLWFLSWSSWSEINQYLYCHFTNYNKIVCAHLFHAK